MIHETHDEIAANRKLSSSMPFVMCGTITDRTNSCSIPIGIDDGTVAPCIFFGPFN
jgi:hypothetical protein